MEKMNIGINPAHRETIAQGLKLLLADSYTLYLHTHNFHWKVVGPSFHDLPLLVEEHYNELAVAVDDIAERIRTLGVVAPGTYKQFAELSRIEEVEGVPNAETMIEILTASHEQVVRTCREVLRMAQEGEDESSVALISDRMRVHEKTAWMLRALQQPA